MLGSAWMSARLLLAERVEERREAVLADRRREQEVERRADAILAGRVPNAGERFTAERHLRLDVSVRRGAAGVRVRGTRVLKNAAGLARS